MQVDRVDTRTKLKPRNAPYWLRLSRGRHIGFRKLKRSSPGTWLARHYTGAKYEYKALGEFVEFEERARYDAARRAADDWFRHLDHGGRADSGTVRAACAAYVAKRRAEGSEGAASDAEMRFRRLIDDDPLGAIELSKLTARQVGEWKGRLLARELGHSTVNRNLTAIRAALNLAYRRRDIASNHAWAEELRPLAVDTAAAKRRLYLDRGERQRLIDAAPEEVRPLLRTLALLPLRVGEAAALKAEHLDARHKLLRIPSGKTGSREIALPAVAFEHLKECTRGKLPSAWLVSRADGRQWERHAWKQMIHVAVRTAKLPRAVCAYTLRHSTITDLVTAGVDLFTVAKISGTSIAMIEKHYGQLQQEHARSALEKLAFA